MTGLVVGGLTGLLINAFATMLLVGIVGGVIASYYVDFVRSSAAPAEDPDVKRAW